MNKFLQFLKNIKAKIKSLFTGKVESEIGKIGEKLVKEYDHALDLFVEGIRNASDNLAYTERTGNKAKEMSRYAKQGGKFSDALTEKEWGIFYSSAMKGIQRTSFRIGDDGIVLLGDKFSKVIYYEDVDGDLEVKAVYKVENYDYNIHSKEANIYEVIVGLERGGTDEEYIGSILRNHSVLFGSLFKKYNSHTGRYVKYPRGSYKSSQPNSSESTGAEVSGGTEKSDGVKYQSRDADYLSAVKRGDMQTAQRMVDETARAARIFLRISATRYRTVHIS